MNNQLYTFPGNQNNFLIQKINLLENQIKFLENRINNIERNLMQSSYSNPKISQLYNNSDYTSENYLI